MSYRIKILLLALAASLLIGWLTSPLVSNVRDQYSDPALETKVSSLSENLGQGISLAVLGGYRNISGNLVWVRMYMDWQYRRKPEVMEKIKLAVALNPGSEFFWLDATRIIANDMPVWEVGDLKMNTLFETSEGKEVRMRYGREALKFLENAPEEIANREKILREKGVIHWRKLEDLPTALEYFAKAAAQPNAPYYLSRVYAEMLVQNGQVGEALDFLRRHYETLPDDNLRAMKPVVARRIQELEFLQARED